MTIRHKISKYLGCKTAPNATYYAHFGGCGAKILSLTQFAPGQEVTLGKEPHVFCARCFPAPDEGANVRMPNDIAETPVYDENGRLIPAHDNDESCTGRQQGTQDTGRPTPVDQGDLGKLDNRPYG